MTLGQTYVAGIDPFLTSYQRMMSYGITGRPNSFDVSVYVEEQTNLKELSNSIFNHRKKFDNLKLNEE